MEDVALRDTFSGHGADGLDWVILVGFSNLIDYSPGAGSLPAPAALTSKFFVFGLWDPWCLGTGSGSLGLAGLLEASGTSSWSPLRTACRKGGKSRDEARREPSVGDRAVGNQ